MLLLGLIHSSRMTRYFFQKWRSQNGLGFFCKEIQGDAYLLEAEDISKIGAKFNYDYGLPNRIITSREVIVHCLGDKYINLPPMFGMVFIVERGETYGYDVFVPFKD